MTVALETALAKAGLRVDAREFLRLVEDAARKVSPPHPNPAEYFSPGQRMALGEVGLDLNAYNDDEPDPRARTVAAHAVLAESAYSVNDAARLLRVDASRVRHRLAAGRLAGWKDQGWRLPAWQFTADGVLPGLEVVLSALPEDQPPLVVAAFMNTPQSDLVINGKPATPRQWLLALGDPKPVAELAAALGIAA
ncbi:MAG: DNA-binding protein [Haloechinothrix sp.]